MYVDKNSIFIFVIWLDAFHLHIPHMPNYDIHITSRYDVIIIIRPLFHDYQNIITQHLNFLPPPTSHVRGGRKFQFWVVIFRSGSLVRKLDRN